MFNRKISIVATILLMVSSAAFAGDGSTAGDYGGVSITDATSPHNLGGTVAADNGEVCVYCHTPHAANIAFSGAPLWNKVDAGLTFTMYGSTVAGNATDAAPASSSLACLSCHDGVSAIDSIVNAPGSGMGSSSAGTVDINSLVPFYGGNIGGTLGTTTVGNPDLTNDHPVSITYVVGAASLRATGDTLPTGSYAQAWVTPDGGTTVASLLRSGKVECGSCHDPHNATGIAQDTSKQVNYLRHSNKNSELCFGCHNK